MSKKRSDALQALIGEVVEIESDLTRARECEETARVAATEARQALDIERGLREAVEARLAETNRALRIIAERDEVSEDTLAALRARLTP